MTLLFATNNNDLSERARVRNNNPEQGRWKLVNSDWAKNEINRISSKVGGQAMIYSIALAKKWTDKCPHCPPGSDVPAERMGA